MSLANLVNAALWTPRAAFPPSRQLSDRLFSLGGGYYLMTNPRRGEGDPVRGVGWAESDYWAQRAWDTPPFAGDLRPPAPQWQGPPSLDFLGRPDPLFFAAVCEFERSTGRAPSLALESARYRLTDGAFLSVEVRGADGLFYQYAQPGPRPKDLPAAIEIRLPEHLDRNDSSGALR